MKLRIFLSLFTVALVGSTVFAQGHAGDIEIGYDGGNLVFEVGESTSEGFAFFEADFEEVLGSIEADEPGFDTDPSKPITTGHEIWARLLNASDHSDIGVGHINYYNPMSGMLESTEGDLAIFQEGNTPVSDLVFENGAYVSGSFTQFIDTANASGIAHGHLTFNLREDANAARGAYGMMFELESYFDGFDGVAAPDLVSDKLWIVLNNGLTDAEFEGAEIAFGINAIPEPASAFLILAGVAGLGMKRRRLA